MKTSLKWNQGMAFEAESAGQKVSLDAKSPIGKGQGITPKELILAGIGGCTAMDVVALMKKHKQPLESMTVDVEAELVKKDSLSIFPKADVRFVATGNVDAKILLDAVQLSQTKYCGVSAMLAKAFPIYYTVTLNGTEIGNGQADFSAINM